MRTLKVPRARRHHATTRGGGECLSQGGIPHVPVVDLAGDGHVGRGRTGPSECSVRRVTRGNFLWVLRATVA